MPGPCVRAQMCRVVLRQVLLGWDGGGASAPWLARIWVFQALLTHPHACTTAARAACASALSRYWVAWWRILVDMTQHAEAQA